MEPLKRYCVFVNENIGGLDAREDEECPWIFDPDHKIDVSQSYPDLSL